MKKVPPGVPYEEIFIEDFRKDPEEAIHFLNACLEEDDPRVFFVGLKIVIEALGGATQFSRKTKLGRVSIYKMLSKKGNPGFMNVLALLSCAGITLRAVSIDKTKNKGQRTKNKAERMKTVIPAKAGI